MQDKNTLVYEYTEHQRKNGLIIAIEHWRVVTKNSTKNLSIVTDFVNPPHFKCGDVYLPTALLSEFENLCIDPTLYRHPEKLESFIAKIQQHEV
jgi:hypothetical protein